MSKTAVRVAILGATGYGGGELLRLLLREPGVEIVAATSRSKAGTPVSSIHRNLDGVTTLAFSDPSQAELVEMADVIFGALPHGASAETLAPLVDAGKRVIDLSGDFRLKDPAAYRQWYKHEHPRPDLFERAVYGCPELYRDQIASAQLVASPGCFATAINLALLPAAKEGLLQGIADVVGLTGSSGSGAEPGAGTHHPTREQTIRPYKVLSHQHVPECLQLAAEAGSLLEGLSFTPLSAPLVRGILAIATCRLAGSVSTGDIARLYSDTYADAEFVKVIADREPEVAPIAGTNYAEVRARVTGDGRLHVIIAIDNLVKGGAGQAVESFGIMYPDLQLQALRWPGTWP